MRLEAAAIPEENRRRAARWLALAACAVAVSGLFAILIALARVPALGTLFPGPEFYRVALTLHVNLSQGVWFMAFAGVLWSLAPQRQAAGLDRLAWGGAVCGAVGMALSVSVGRPTPLMSNYVPVLDSPLFLTSLSLFGFGVAVKAAMALVGPMRPSIASLAEVQHLALRIAAAGTLVVFGLLIAAAAAIGNSLEGFLYFETLFWGGGHVWQFVLTSLLIFCWLQLAPAGARRLPAPLLAGIVIAAALPILAAMLVPFSYPPGSAGHAQAYTWLMQWTSWEAPLLLGAILLFPRASQAPGFGLSLLLFVAGLLLGAAINGQTTLVTAHYHGTIGAVTLAFMAAAFALLPRLGVEPPGPRAIRLQLGFYGYGILLMMAGLAGAGLMGAPRKTPGELGVAWNVETFSRICLGVGGLLATVGIIMFAVLIIRRFFPAPSLAAYSR